MKKYAGIRTKDFTLHCKTIKIRPFLQSNYNLDLEMTVYSLKHFNQIAMTVLVLTLCSVPAFAAKRTYFENGKVQSETVYNGTMPEKTLWYNDAGILQSEERFVGADTKVITFFNPEGKKTTEETRTNGILMKVRTFYASGNVEQEYTVKNNVIDGKLTIYYESGKIKAEHEFKDGKEI